MPDDFSDVAGTELPQDAFVCPRCGTLHDARNPYCEGCGAPVGTAATLDPIQTIASAGTAYRGAVRLRRQAGMVCFGCWLLFLPQIFGVLIGLVGLACPPAAFPELVDFPISGCGRENLFVDGIPWGSLGMLLGLLGLYVAILWRVTRRYLSRRAEGA